MQIRFTQGALAFLAEQGAVAVTVASLVFSSCCSGPLAPEVKPGVPADADGFLAHTSEGLTLYYDSLLPPREAITIGLREFPTYRELFVQGWE